MTNCYKKLYKKLFIPLSLLSAAFYVIDVFSDVILAIRHFGDGQIEWGAWTLTFFLVPWAALLAEAVWYRLSVGGTEDSATASVYLLAAALHLYPAALLLHAAWLRWKGDEENAKLTKGYSVCYGVICLGWL